MRRLFIYLMLAILVIGAWRALHHHPAFEDVPTPAPPPHRHHGPPPHHKALVAEAHRAAAEARRALADAGREARDALRDAGHEVRDAYREARDDIRRAYRDAVADRDDDLPPPPLPPVAVRTLEDAEGLPVPIVPGTRVTEAEASPPVAVLPPVPARTVSQPAPADDRARFHRTVAGDICATEDRARADARKALRFQVAEWLGPEVPASWEPPAPMLDAMVVATRLDPLVKDYGRLYTAQLTADFSPERRAGLVRAYNRELVRDRLTVLAGVLAFILFCLAAISGYIRADEATRGYYTNRLRMLAAAGVGAAGVAAYRMLV